MGTKKGTKKSEDLKESKNLLLRIGSGLLKAVNDTVKVLKEIEGEDQVNRAEFIRESAEVFTKIPPTELVKLRRLARENGIILASLIREAIQAYVTVDEPSESKTPPLILSILRQRAAEKQGIKAKAKQ